MRRSELGAKLTAVVSSESNHDGIEHLCGDSVIACQQVKQGQLVQANKPIEIANCAALN